MACGGCGGGASGGADSAFLKWLQCRRGRPPCFAAAFASSHPFLCFAVLSFPPAAARSSCTTSRLRGWTRWPPRLWRTSFGSCPSSMGLGATPNTAHMHTPNKLASTAAAGVAMAPAPRPRWLRRLQRRRQLWRESRVALRATLWSPTSTAPSAARVSVPLGRAEQGTGLGVWVGRSGCLAGRVPCAVSGPLRCHSRPCCPALPLHAKPPAAMLRSLPVASQPAFCLPPSGASSVAAALTFILTTIAASVAAAAAAAASAGGA